MYEERRRRLHGHLHEGTLWRRKKSKKKKKKNKEERSQLGDSDYLSTSTHRSEKKKKRRDLASNDARLLTALASSSSPSLAKYSRKTRTAPTPTSLGVPNTRILYSKANSKMSGSSSKSKTSTTTSKGKKTRKKGKKKGGRKVHRPGPRRRPQWRVVRMGSIRRKAWFLRLLTPNGRREAAVGPSPDGGGEEWKEEKEEEASSHPTKSRTMNWKFWKKKKKDVIEGAGERRLRANDPEYNKQLKYADNYIKTSKYNIITFIPHNLFEQFQRIANSYFLVLLVLQLIPQISSVSWYTTLIPLVIVLAFSAIKDGYDDVQRHMSDRTVNNRKSYVVREGKLAEEPWANVRVGDVIRMMSNQFVAADLIVLSTSEPHGISYIETKELDGETNLKTKSALGETEAMGDDLDSISKFNGEVVCEAPNNKLDKFQGQLMWKQKTSPITNDNVLLRGCILKNTRWCYGLVIFAGKDTKLMMNSGKSKFKRTSLDRFLNILILGIVVFLIAMCLICSVLCGVWEWTTGRYFRVYLPWDTVIPDPAGSSGPAGSISLIAFLTFFSYVILLNTVVPISLYVSVEILRFIHSMWINFDEKMYFENGENSVGAQARTTTLNEELGQVQYIFSDKTGTLTQNIMTFNKASINGVSYGDLRDPRGNIVEINERTPKVDFSFNEHYESSFTFYDRVLLEATRQNVAEVCEFWLILSLCHTVMPERGDKGQLVYQAQSPDEAALTSAARNFGFVFISRTPNSITIKVEGKEVTYDLLCILDFNNDRKRMSVILRCPDGKIKLYCKGADMMLMARLSPSTSQLLKEATVSHLDDFAKIGLRTLCLAYKNIDEAYFKDWHRRQQEAALDMYNREKKLDEVFEEMETDLILVGATAIEDKLQDGVPEAIARLAAANIKIWVLTGDKTETAINIAYSCNLLSDEMKHIVVIEGASEPEVEVQLKDTKRLFAEAERHALPFSADGKPRVDIAVIGDDGGYVNHGLNPDFDVSSSGMIEEGSPSPLDVEGDGVALVINGDSLGFALGERLERTFLELACSCKAVICCRVTPLQKAQVVDLVKRNKKAVTLSIGDGANDVSMIKTAHIGVGISGQEGMQAVLSSDYSIGQFKYLERLLLVHGRWSYFRMCKFLRYFFYKNFSFTLTHFWFSFFVGYSAQTVFDAIVIATYNLIFTSLPVLAMGVLDQDVDDEWSLKFPKLYMPGQYNMFFNMRIFIYSVLHGMFSSLVIFFVPYGAFYNEMDHSGRDMGDWPVLAFTTFTALIIVVSGQIAFDTSYWTAINHIVLWGSLAVYFAFAFIVYEAFGASFQWKLGVGTSQSQNVVLRAMATPHFWFSILLICIVLLLPVMLNRFFWLDTHPSFADRLRANRKMRPEERRGEDKLPPKDSLGKRTGQTRRSQRGSLRSGYAFSHSQGFGDLIVKGKLFKNVDNLRRDHATSRTTGVHLSPIEELPSPPRMVSAIPVANDPPLVSRVPKQPSSRPLLSSTSRRQSTPMGAAPQPHLLTVNVDRVSEMTVPGQPSPHSGTRIRGDGSSPTRASRRKPKIETQDSSEEETHVVRL